MQNDQTRFLGERAAEIYDDVVERGDTVATVAFLERLARAVAAHLTRLKERWAGWDGEPFTAADNTYVSVYGR